MMLATLDRPELNEADGASASPSTTVTRVALVVEYDGTRYFGFQFQDDRPTVQAELEKAVLKLTGETIRVVASSRTDTGVHALGQVVSFRTGSALPMSSFVSGLNHYLPRNVAVRSAHRLATGFHVQRTAVSRHYEYRILNRPTRSPLEAQHSHLVREPLDVRLMHEAAQALLGEHDLASFTSVTGARMRSTVRRVDRAEVQRDGDMVVFTIIASSFLPHQVRNTVGALIEVGRGRLAVADFASLIERREPGRAGPRAPASGLYLVRVDYPRPFEEEA